MRIVLDDFLSDELREYLLTQNGIVSVDLTVKDFISELIIGYDEKINPMIIMKYIELFQNCDYSTMLEFDKGYVGKYKTFTYIVNDLCCEYCYKGLVMDLFEHKKIKAVKSNFDFGKSTRDVEFLIDCDLEYGELIKYIEEKL